MGNLGGNRLATASRTSTPGHRSNKQVRLVAITDFKTHNARYSLGLPRMAVALPTLFKSLGPQDCCLFMHLATHTKEYWDINPLEDEVAIRNKFRNASLGAQSRAQMLVSMPAGTKTFVAVPWQGLKFCYLYAAVAIATATCKSQTEEPNFRRCSSMLAKTTLLKGHPPIALPANMVGIDRQDTQAKAAQTRPAVHQGVPQEIPIAGCGTRGQGFQETGNTMKLDVTHWVGIVQPQA